MTGGAGFIGTHLCERLVERNRVTIYDSLLRDALRYTELAGRGDLTFVQGDVLDARHLTEAAADADIVIHLAAVAGASVYAKRPLATMRVNLLGTANALEAAREAGVQRFLNFSSSEVYGPVAQDVREQDATTLGPVSDLRWTYSASKLAGEFLALSYGKETGLPVVSARPFNVFGPRQVGEGAISIFITRALKNEPLVVRGDGSQTRAWCYIDDLVAAVMQMLEREDCIGNTFNIGNPAATVSVLDLARLIVELTGSSSEVVFHDHEFEDIRHRAPNVEKAQSMLGFVPKVSLESGLERTVAWYQEHIGEFSW